MKLIIQLFLVTLLWPIFSTAQVQNNGNLRMHNGSSIGLFGDFSNNGSFNNNLGTLHAAGPNPQTFNGSNTIQAYNFTINKSSNLLQLDNVLKINNLLTFINGSIRTDHADVDTEFVEFLDDASYTGESDSSHIDGVVRKIGNDAFVFPTGTNAILRPISITGPAFVADHFTTYYTETNPDTRYTSTSLGADLDHISACEYWVLNRTGGSSTVAVSLSWDSNSCGVDNLCDLRISRWDGTQWMSEGNGGVAGTVVSGTLVSGTSCSLSDSLSSFGTFTLGSFNSNNPLPISLLSFDAVVCESLVCLAWQTASEINNDYFTVEKSINGISWEGFAELKGAGNSHRVLDYKTIDESPFMGLSYYRLKQTDFNGEFEYSAVKVVYFDHQNKQEIIIYPNPATENITIEGLSSQVNQIEIYNMLGQEVSSFVAIIQSSESYLQLDISLLKPGIYYLKTNKDYSPIIKQ